MKTKFTTLNVVTTAMLAAVAVIMANVFHHILGELTSLFSPMHFPVLLCGIMCGPWLGMICGFIAPLTSFLSSGSPKFPNGLIPMIIELAAYGFITGLMRWVFLKNTKTSRFASILALIIAMIAGRLLNAFVGAFFMMGDASSYFAALGAKILGNFTSTWAGIVLQLTLIPLLLFALKRGGILIKYLPDTPEEAPKQPAEQATEQAE